MKTNNLSDRFFSFNVGGSANFNISMFPMSSLTCLRMDSATSLLLSFENSFVMDHDIISITIESGKGKEAIKDIVDVINSTQQIAVLADNSTKKSIINNIDWDTAPTQNKGVAGTFALSGKLTVAGSSTFTGRIIETLAVVNIDAQNGTLLASTVLSGILQHTSATGGGTLTTDTAANYINGLGLTADNMSVKCYYINDGDQTVTIAAGVGVTLQDAGQTIAENESAILLVRRTNATNVKVYILGA